MRRRGGYLHRVQRADLRPAVGRTQHDLQINQVALEKTQDDQGKYSEDKIKEAIQHPDLDVRDKAIRYFYSSTSPDDTLMPLAIQAIERYGRTKAFSFTHYLNLLPQTEQTIDWVIAELRSDFEGRPEEQHFYYLNLSRLLCHADIRLVAQHASEIVHAPHFDPKE